MRPGREMDARIAKEVFGYRVWAQAKVLYENAPKGDRPLRNYSKELEWAQEVMQAMKITLIPVEGGEWFAFTGPVDKIGWQSPQAVLQFLEGGNFSSCGAAVGPNIAQVVCEAALKATEKRQALASQTTDAEQAPAELATDRESGGASNADVKPALSVVESAVTDLAAATETLARALSVVESAAADNERNPDLN